jgi:hypothetical protein
VASYTFTNVTANHTISATFAIKTYTITASAGAGGSISPSGAVSVNCSANQTFNITADSCYNIAAVLVDGSPVGAVASYTFTNVTANHTISATFAIKTYTMTVNVTPSGGGNVTVNGATPSGYPNTTTWNCGENVTLNAVAASGYSFVNWSGDLGGSVNPTNITMTSIKDVTAHFSAVIHNLTVISDGCCPINVSGAVSGTVPAGGNKTFTGIGEGGEVTVSVDDSAGCCKFDNWSDAGAQTHTITMNSDKSVTAYCSVPSYDLTVNVTPSGDGNVTVNGVTPPSYPNSTTWVCGSNVTLNAVAASGYHFVNWTGSLTGSTNPTNITMNSDKSVTANFAINRYNLTTSSTSGGNVTIPGEGTYTYNYGTVVNLVATADANYHFVNWTGSLTGSTNPTNITMNSDKNVTANFAINRYNLTINSTAGGNVTTPGEGTYTYNASQVVNLVATADANYHFVNWTGDVGTVGNVNSSTTNITMNSDKNVTANFAINRYNLNISSTSGGNVTTPGEGTYTYNASQVVDLVATADANYTFVNWTGDVGTVGNVTSATTNITMNGNYTIVANFNFTGHEPIICVSPPSLSLKVAPNTTVTKTYTITNCGDGTLHWDSSNVTYVPNGNMTWLSQNITSGTLTANASQTVLLTVNTTGLPKGTYNASITITGSTFIFPIILDVTTDIDVMRNLPDDALDVDAEYPGDSFWVYVNFTAPVDEFNSIGLTDLAPAGWEVETDVSWCTPVASWTMSPGNKVEYSWSGELNGYPNGTKFSAKYLVTIPATASPGYSYWPNCNISEAWVEYWFGPEGPYKSCITGDFRKIVTVPGEVWGETRDVNADLLTTTLVVCYEEPPEALDEPEDSDSSTEPDALYKVDVDDTGQYWLNASKYCYFALNTSAMPVTRNPAYPDYINFTTVELLAAGYNMDFEGDYGLVPKACTMSYAMKSVNHWLFIPTDDGGSPHPEWQLSNWKAMESVHSWQFPCGCNT